MNPDAPVPAPDAELASLRKKARLWTAICYVSAAVAFTGNFLPDRWTAFPLTGLVVFLATLWPAYRLRSTYGLAVRRRAIAPLAAEQVETTDRPPVLYLRSFDDDRQGGRIKGSFSEEEHLAKVLSQIGPFVAVGRPGEPLPEAGASRVYVDDTNWQATVEDFLRRARLVIIRTGRTGGLEWEIEKSVRLLDPKRLVLLVDSTRELRDVLAGIRRVHPQVPARVRMGWRSISGVKGFIVFDDQWRPTCLRARGPGPYFFRTADGDVGHIAKRFAWTLRPLFRRLDIAWQPPPLNWGLIVLGALSAALFAAAIVVDLLGF